MIKYRSLSLGIWFVLLCLLAGPAMGAVLFDFHVGSLLSEFDSSTGDFSAVRLDSSTLTLTRQAGATPESATLTTLGPFNWGLGDFSLDMDISDITESSAKALGSFHAKDWYGSDLTGAIDGLWTPNTEGTANNFKGTLSGVTYSETGPGAAFYGSQFGGYTNEVSMYFVGQAAPWLGAMVELSTTGTWFNDGSFDTTAGSVDASVIPVPVPGAIVLGLLGMGVAGLRLRRRR